MEREALESLSGLRLYFGHQSVGENILDGVGRFLREAAGTSIRVVETEDPAALAPGVFAHSKIGANEAPDTKIAHFERVLRAGVGERADVAFMKLCYIDFDDPKLDVDALFEKYRSTTAALERDYPGLTLVHVTAPLTQVATGPKAWVKHKLGKDVWGEQENVRRHAFNEKMRAAFGAGGRLFDVARWESQRGDGELHTFERDGARVPALLPGFTDDGGHLNALGRRFVAGALIRFLASLKIEPRAAATPVVEEE